MDIGSLSAKWLENLAKSEIFPGIYNYENNCYANSILQVFNHTPSFLNYFKNYPCDCRNMKSREINEGCGSEKNSESEQIDKFETSYELGELCVNYQGFECEQAVEPEQGFESENYFDPAQHFDSEQDFESHNHFDALDYFDSDQGCELVNYRGLEDELESDMDLKDLFKTDEDGEVDLESDEDEDCYHCLLKEHVEMFEKCQSSNEIIVPFKILKALERSDPIEFKFGDPADASEFLDKISDKLEDSNNKSVMSDIYSSKIATIYHCKSCGNEWRNVGTEKLLLCKNGKTENITDKLAEMSKDVGCPNTCEKCNVQGNSTEKRIIDSPPRNLTIKIADFKPDSAGKTHFPEKINIRPYMEVQTGSEVMYELFAVVVAVSVFHSKYPHYFAFCRAPNGQWNCCNDTDVRKTSLEDVLNCDPYFMIYRRSPDLDKRITPTERDDKEEIEPRISIRNFEISPKSFYGH